MLKVLRGGMLPRPREAMEEMEVRLLRLQDKVQPLLREEREKKRHV